MIDLKKNQFLFIVGFCRPVVEFESAKADALYLGKAPPFQLWQWHLSVLNKYFWDEWMHEQIK